VGAVNDADLDELTGVALAARDGDRAALEALCRAMLPAMYRLALRFCGTPADAEDAAQEVMIRLVTHLGSFEGRSRFTTWAYTVAVRQLMRAVRRPAEASVGGAEDFAAFLDAHVADPVWDPAAQADYDELCADVRLSCTYGMLLCLSREHRVAYLLGDLLGFTDVDGAQVCGIGRAAFRQRLARAPVGDARPDGQAVRSRPGQQPVPVRPAGPRQHRRRRARSGRSALGPPPRGHAADRNHHHRGRREGTRPGRRGCRGLPVRPVVRHPARGVEQARRGYAHPAGPA
jgi:RNA polymerase sigma factor (sigma-70 family)